MTTLVVQPASQPLLGSVPVPADSNIGHRALILAALADGDTRLTAFVQNRPLRRTVECLRCLGVGIVDRSPQELVVSGVGLFGLAAPVEDLACDDSAATMKLLCGLLAAQPFRSKLTGDETLSRRPTTSLVRALRRRGAFVEGRVDPALAAEVVAPLVIGPLEQALSSLEYESAAVDSDLKSALLLSGLYADGPTLFREPTVSRDHTERLLDALGVPIRTAGTIVQLDPAAWNNRLPAFDLVVPGDLSAAAFSIVAAQLVPASRVTTRGVGINPTRTGLLEIARDMGAGLTIEPQGERCGEPVATLHAWSAPLRATLVGGETIQRATDDFHAACALASRATGTTRLVFADAQNDDVDADTEARIGGASRLLRAFGIVCTCGPGTLDIEGRDGPLEAARVDSGGDAAIAMAAVVLALVANGPTHVGNAACIGARYPKFVATMRALGARIEVEA